MGRKRGQAATEYLILSGFVFVAISVGVAILYSYGTESMRDIASAQMSKICQDIASTSESVYYMGEPARRTIDASFPTGVKKMEVERNDPATGCTECTEIRFDLLKGKETEKVICSTNVNISVIIDNKSISPGLKHIRVDSRGDYVLLNMSS
ncbi:hypothetical protein JXA85_08755 [Candidatus Woesearchaeota archaeon]|nr:hypothetical protein [Candidatus Woesearchaeota archaeon]